MVPTTLPQDYTCPWKAQRYLCFIYTVYGITPAGELDFHILTSLTANFGGGFRFIIYSSGFIFVLF